MNIGICGGAGQWRSEGRIAMQSLVGLPSFLAYFCTAFVITIGYLYVYTLITPHDELELIRRNNVAAAIALGLSLLGFASPVASVIAHTESVIDCAIWSFARGRGAERRFDRLLNGRSTMKRSAHVSLVLMGALGVGGAAYALGQLPAVAAKHRGGRPAAAELPIFGRARFGLWARREFLFGRVVRLKCGGRVVTGIGRVRRAGRLWLHRGDVSRRPETSDPFRLRFGRLA
jgi:hypothetical protein